MEPEELGPERTPCDRSGACLVAAPCDRNQPRTDVALRPSVEWVGQTQITRYPRFALAGRVHVFQPMRIARQALFRVGGFSSAVVVAINSAQDAWGGPDARVLKGSDALAVRTESR